MPKRRQLLALAAPFALFAAKPGGLPNVTLNAKDVKIQKNPFGELRIYFDGPTDQLRAMTAGSLLLNAGATPIRPTPIRKKSSWSSPRVPAKCSATAKPSRSDPDP